eukprot:608034-Prymnesium_polylepis.1
MKTPSRTGSSARSTRCEPSPRAALSARARACTHTHSAARRRLRWHTPLLWRPPLRVSEGGRCCAASPVVPSSA